jgi:hypothetical protein
VAAMEPRFGRHRHKHGNRPHSVEELSGQALVSATASMG